MSGPHLWYQQFFPKNNNSALLVWKNYTMTIYLNNCGDLIFNSIRYWTCNGQKTPNNKCFVSRGFTLLS